MFFSIFFIIILALAVLIFFTNIKLEIKKLEISNVDTIKVNYDYVIYLKLYFLNFIKWFQIKIDKEKVNNTGLLQKVPIKNIKKDFKNIDISLKNLKPEIENLDLYAKVGTESMFLTSAAVLLISVGMSYLLSKSVKKRTGKNHKYVIEPSYVNKNIIDLKLNCIIKVKMVNIINIIYNFFKKRRGLKNERASNRRIDDYCNEQYPRYGRCKHNYRRTN